MGIVRMASLIGMLGGTAALAYNEWQARKKGEIGIAEKLIEFKFRHRMREAEEAIAELIPAGEKYWSAKAKFEEAFEGRRDYATLAAVDGPAVAFIQSSFEFARVLRKDQRASTDVSRYFFTRTGRDEWLLANTLSKALEKEVESEATTAERIQVKASLIRTAELERQRTEEELRRTNEEIRRLKLEIRRVKGAIERLQGR